METQNWEGMHLDKDILIQGNNIYSPSLCVFVPPRTNSLLTDSKKAGSKSSNLPLGVRYKRDSKMTQELSKPYEAFCNLNGEQIFLGTYRSMQEAHRRWQETKINAIQHEIQYLKNLGYKDIRVYGALQGRIETIISDITKSLFTTAL